MFKKISIVFLACILLFGNFIGYFQAPVFNFTPTSKVSAESNNTYEIYPLPQNETYDDSTFSITDEVNVVIESTIDEDTQSFLEQLLDSKSITMTISEEVVSDQTNVILGTHGSQEYVNSYFEENLSYEEETFNEIDSYVLSLSNDKEANGTIAILGDTSDATYYGLATLKMIFDQMEGNTVRSVQYEDFSDTSWRGFIEGFYGFPWSHEDRISLMQFGGEFKMNTYIFAPKDDKYHNSEWRTLYPEDELAKIEELVDVGHESKTQFVWAIHPGFNMIDWDDYDNELDTLLTKLDQLYSVGVRQFGLFMDDISTSVAMRDMDHHVQLITDVANWIEEKGDVRSLIYCPPFYNQSWTGSYGLPYLEALGDVPENVDIMWTGRGVVGTVNETDMQWPKDAHGRDSYMWLNWPVNDYKDSRLMLGKGEVLHPGTHNIAGVVSNPMGHAELSKIALFAVADFTWNVDDFNDDQSWLDSFKYIAPEVAEELNTVAYHLSDPSPSGHGLVVGESENIKAELEAFLTGIENGEDVHDVGNELLVEFDTILQAITSFKANNQNQNMVEEITPWLNSLEKVVEADQSAVKSALAIQAGDMDAAWEELVNATNAMEASKQFTIEKLNYPDVTVEAGAKRLVPFAEKLISMLDQEIYTTINPEAIIPSPLTSYETYPNLNPMVDGDESSYVYIQIVQENGDWYGVDLGKQVEVNDIEIIQGRNDEDHDIFQRGVLEYSEDGEVWHAIGEEKSGFHISEANLELEARYIRYRLTHAGIPGGKPDLWTAIREFKVNSKGTVDVYTNVDELQQVEVKSTDVSSEITDLQGITLNPSEYIGVNFPSIEQIATVELDVSSSDLVLESSENGVEWNEVDLDGPFANAAYFRLINNGEQAVSFNLAKLAIELNKFSDPVVSHNYEGVYSGQVDQLFDGNLEDKVWFSGMQDAGKYVQVDIGGIVDLENVAVVIGDGEGDYFRKGDLQISIDGETWETIHTFNNPEDRSVNFPDHEVPYRYLRAEVEDQQARYVRLVSTEDHNVWFALNEIIVNEGQNRPGAENPAIEVEPNGDTGFEGVRAIDKLLSTYFTPIHSEAGYLNYKLSEYTNVGEMVILQDPAAISEADVFVRDLNGWHEVGKLSKAFNIINTSKFEHVLEVKLEWDENTNPKIYEIFPVKREKVAIDTLDEELQMAYDEGWISNHGILNSLLAKVSTIQKHQDNSEKVLNGLRALENQVNALKGKKIDDDYAEVLLGIIEELAGQVE